MEEHSPLFNRHHSTIVTTKLEYLLVSNLYTVGIWIPNKSECRMPNGPVLECHLNTRQTPSCFPMYWSSIQMVGPNHLKFELQKVWYSNVSGFQIPTVLHVLIFQSNSIPGSRDLSPCSSTTDRLAHPRLGSIQTSTDGKAQKGLSVRAIFNIYSGDLKSWQSGF